MIEHFYDSLAPYYHLVFEDWEESMRRQGEVLDGIIRAEWGGTVRTVLDAAAGIGTQALPLAARGYTVTASDLSAGAIARARREAQARHLSIVTTVADLRRLSQAHAVHDLVLACDNALPHLLTDREILQALVECYRCTAPGGGCLLSIRDYGVAPGRGSELRPHGVRIVGGKRYIVYQVWDWHGSHYDVALCIMEDTGGAECRTEVFRSRYYAIPLSMVQRLMEEAGYTRIRRIEDAHYLPILVGTRAA
jgi:SAM-dependent methyltransferase